MTISLMATDDKKRMMEQAVTVLSAPAADERYRPVCDAMQKGDLRQAQWTFLQLSGDTSSAVSHFLTAFFLCCDGHWQLVLVKAAGAMMNCGVFARLYRRILFCFAETERRNRQRQRLPAILTVIREQRNKIRTIPPGAVKEYVIVVNAVIVWVM